MLTTASARAFAVTDFGRFPEHYTVEHEWKQRKKTGTWQVPQTQEGYDTQWSVDYGVGEDAGKGHNLKLREGNSNQGCHAVIGPDDVNRGVAKGAAKNGYPDCCGREVKKAGIFRVRLDDGSTLTCYRCGLHGGRSAGGDTGAACYHPGCSKPSSGKAVFKRLIHDKSRCRYCDDKCLKADAPRRQLFEDIRKALGWNDPDVQAKLTALNTKQQPETPAEALAQLNTILAAGTLQAVQDALDAGPSGASGP